MSTVSEGTSPWATETVSAIFRGWANGEISRCPHMAPPAFGGVIELLAADLRWKRSACRECTTPDLFPDLVDEPAHCDGCDATGRDLYQAAAIFRTRGVILHYVMCEACSAADGRTPPTST